MLLKNLGSRPQPRSVGNWFIEKFYVQIGTLYKYMEDIIMALQIIKWISFGVAVLDLISYVSEKFQSMQLELSKVVGVIIGIYLRTYIMYGALIYWILK